MGLIEAASRSVTPRVGDHGQRKRRVKEQRQGHSQG